MTTKHTPGPWEWVDNRMRGGYSGICGADGTEVLFANCANDGDTGAAWFEDFPSEDDARLIAASPDLLKALEAMTVEVDNMARALCEGGDGTNQDLGREWMKYVDQAEAAIAKATGESNG